MMNLVLPLVDEGAAAFWLFDFPQDNPSLLQILSSNVLPLAGLESAIILKELAKLWAARGGVMRRV